MKIGVVIPCYKVKSHVLDVIGRIGNEVAVIYAVDDACPQQSGNFILEQNTYPRVKVLFNKINKGVGGAVITGYKEAIKDNIDIVVKIDGDGQMAPELIKKFVTPLIEQRADYAKGNRFHSIESLVSMPIIRKMGNAVLSFINKISSGYWRVMDPTNGYTAIHIEALKQLPLEKINNRYFFESDMLFRLGTIRAVVQDISMKSVYADEKSNLVISKVIFEFSPLYLKAFIKRIFYTYFLRDFNIASIELIFGTLLFTFGSFFGLYRWFQSGNTGVEASTGTVMIAILPMIIGFQLLLSSLHYDLSNMPTTPLQLDN
jgi:dolichol-phosphate mannosyltransferase